MFKSCLNFSSNLVRLVMFRQLLRRKMRLLNGKMNISMRLKPDTRYFKRVSRNWKRPMSQRIE